MTRIRCSLLIAALGAAIAAGPAMTQARAQSAKPAPPAPTSDAQSVPGQPATAETQPIRLGDLSSYGAYPDFTEPYRNGWRMAFAEINAAGGVLGRGIEVVSRDDGGNAKDAVLAARTLAESDKVALIFGTFLSSVALAVSEFASQNRVLFIAALPVSDDLTLQRGNRYTFRPLRASTYMQTAMLADATRSMNARRWAIIAPNYALGRRAAEIFRGLLGELNADVDIVAEHYSPLGRIDAAAAVASLAAARPDAIFSALFGGDLAAFTREAKARKLFDGLTMLNLFVGEPEWLAGLGGDVPEGAIATGYAPNAAALPAHKNFVDAFQRKYGVPPTMGAAIGYMTGYLIKDLIEKAESLETENLLAKAEGLTTETILGQVTMRASDNQGTLGSFVGTLALENGRGVMRDAKYVDGAEFLPPEDMVRTLRPD